MIARILLAILVLIIVLAVAAAGFWFLAPREPVDTTIRFDPKTIGSDPDAYLAREEADIPNLRRNAQKEIVWAYPASRAKTPLAIVYIHGFSAAKAEVRPLPDEVAKALGANLFYTRLTGHGRDGAAMEQASVNDWLNDLAEAVAIGRRIGDRVVVIASSTGGTLATLGASRPQLMDGVEGIVMISPNFAIKDRWAFLLDMPYARRILPMIGGETYGFEPRNQGHAENWTTRYPIGALVPMAALIRAASRLDLSAIRLPLLVLYSQNDKVVDPNATERVLSEWGGPHQAVDVPVSGDRSNHVLAGAILSPQTTDELAERIVEWVKALPGKDGSRK
ncbi:carboxylesterase [Aurantimonas sp. VKM B-3413]|uniref:alpha/beta hydrolase n=1 Tax=Aurantimonas sp. VKM B-3413 TaxID=2779401 RepID=UPI001E394DBC|nr:alpha/beta fold hydrolase [Aurantimonas sp. VKM B-3413]MCB8836601.1 alpha/beta hydrolase [Aurantimonas sp. VKM B-3413]